MGSLSRARLFGLMAVVLWSTAATAFKLSLRFCSAYQLTLVSSIVSLLFLVCYLAVSGKLRLLLDRGTMSGAWLRGFINPFVYYLVLLGAYSRIPAQIAMVINYLWPVMLVLLSALVLRQRIRGRDLGGMALSFSGVVVLSALGSGGGGAGPDPAGLALALGSTLIWALYWILNMKAEGEPAARLAGNFAWGVAYLFAWGLLRGGAGLSGLPVQALIGASWVGLFEMGLTYVVWLEALRLARSTADVGSLIYLTPFASLAFIGLVAHEAVRPATLAGLVLVLAGLRIQGASRRL